LECDIHHQPCDSLGKEYAIPFGCTVGLQCRPNEDIRREDMAKRSQTELLENGCCTTGMGADTKHDKASMQLSDDGWSSETTYNNPFIGGRRLFSLTRLA
jgi:hypothetical protein